MNELQDVVIASWRAEKPLVETHVGDLAWWSREPDARRHVWHDGDTPVAWGWFLASGELEFHVRADRRGAGLEDRVQRAAFTSTMTEEKYERVRAAWPYREELDVVVEAPDGSLAAFCLAWLDEENGAGELEPVGTHPEHRRRGLATAASLEALRRLRDRGADTCVVYAVERSVYPAPLALYTSLGFESCARHVRFER